MNLNNISIRLRFFLLLTGSVLYWMLAGFILLSLIEKFSLSQKASQEFMKLPQDILQLENSVYAFTLNDIPSTSFHASGSSNNVERFGMICLRTKATLQYLADLPGLNGDPGISQKLEACLEYLGSADASMGKLKEKALVRGWHQYGLSGILLEQSGEVNFNVLPGYEESGLEFLSVLRSYLAYPEAGKLNSLTSRADNLEATLSSLPEEQPGRDPLILEFLGNIRQLIQLDHEIGTLRHEGITNQLFRTLEVFYRESETLLSSYTELKDKDIKQIKWGILLVILLSLVIYGTVLILLNRTINRNFKILREFFTELLAGRFPGGVLPQGEGEFFEILKPLIRFLQSLKKKADFATSLAEGKDPEPLEPLGPEDNLAISLINLKENLHTARLEEEKHRISREERRWANEGIAKFGEILRVYNKDISTLAENVIRELVNYLNAGAGGVFLLSDAEEEPKFELVASFAFNRKKYLKKEFRPGEGLIGTCAIEKEKIFLTEIPEDYINIASGLGESKPSCLLLMPLKLEEMTLGVLEIASMKVLARFEIDFVENLAGSIASTVSAVRMNMRTTELLEQSQEQAREMAKQEEVMRQNMEELQATQEESARRESEISGILNGIHNSAHVAEFNMNEELISINDKFLQILGVQRSQMLNKKYHELAGLNKHTDSYKQLWQELQEGKTISRIDRFPVHTGENVWLRQTFTPIPDKDGNPFKVLLIAADITETVEQQESLEKQSNEIKRANIEMKTFSDAVDQALIKCVYSPAGQILEMNENFEKVTGFTGKEMMGKNNRVFLQRVEKEQFEKIWEEVLKDKPYSGVIRRTRPTGDEVWLMSTFTPVKDENGNIFKVFFLGQDITERKLKFQLLEEANREIDRLRKQLDGRS